MLNIIKSKLSLFLGVLRYYTGKKAREKSYPQGVAFKIKVKTNFYSVVAERNL